MMDEGRTGEGKRVKEEQREQTHCQARCFRGFSFRGVVPEERKEKDERDKRQINVTEDRPFSCFFF